MENSKEASYPVFVQLLLEPISNTLFTSFVPGLMSYILLENIYISLLIFLALFLIIAIIYFLSYTTIYMGENGMLVKSRLRSTEVAWDDIVSMSTVYNYIKVLRYQIKTNGATFSFPVPRNWGEFESYVIEKARLEPEGESMVSLFKIYSPGIKRWRRIGQDYSNTSVLDSFLETGYVNGLSGKTKRNLGIAFIFITIVSFLLFYLFNNGLL